MMLALDELFTEVDALIGPFMTGPMLVASNFTGHPCLHLRAGFLDLATRGEASLGSGKLTSASLRPPAARSRFPRASRFGDGCSKRAPCATSAWRWRPSSRSRSGDQVFRSKQHLPGGADQRKEVP